MEHLVIAAIAGVILLLIIMCFVMYMIFAAGEETQQTDPIPLIKLVPGKPKNIKYTYETKNPILHSPIF